MHERDEGFDLYWNGLRRISTRPLSSAELDWLQVKRNTAQLRGIVLTGLFLIAVGIALPGVRFLSRYPHEWMPFVLLAGIFVAPICGWLGPKYLATARKLSRDFTLRTVDTFAGYMHFDESEEGRQPLLEDAAFRMMSESFVLGTANSVEILSGSHYIWRVNGNEPKHLARASVRRLARPPEQPSYLDLPPNHPRIPSHEGVEKRRLFTESEIEELNDKIRTKHISSCLTLRAVRSLSSLSNKCSSLGLAANRARTSQGPQSSCCSLRDYYSWEVLACMRTSVS